MILRAIGRFAVSLANLAEAEGRALKRNVKHFAEQEGRALRRNVEELVDGQAENLRKHAAGLVLTACLLAAGVALVFLGTLTVLAGVYLAFATAMQPAPAALCTGVLTILAGLLAILTMNNQFR
jgi:hypothetical protein